jgi:Mg-chelatase subunit ChlD
VAAAARTGNLPATLTEARRLVVSTRRRGDIITTHEIAVADGNVSDGDAERQDAAGAAGGQFAR